MEELFDAFETLNSSEELGTVTLTLDNDEELECEILTIYTTGGHDYIALAPMREDLEDLVYLYRYIETEDGDPELEPIMDEEEYEIASDGYDEWLDTMEFQQMLDED